MQAAQAKQRSDWDQTSQLLATMMNLVNSKNKAKAIDFNPFRRAQRVEFPVTVLKKLLSDG